jgi:predicted DNA-binding transcriptional regulator AlpA
MEEANEQPEPSAWSDVPRRGVWRPEVETLLLGLTDAATFIGVSRSELDRMDKAGRVVSPVGLGKWRKWSKAILRRWAASGCPTREQWVEMERAR